MYAGSLAHDRIINAFQRHVPGGYIVICRDYRDIPWKDQMTSRKVYRQIPATTLVNLPKGFVTSATRYVGMRLDRPGWRQEFRKAMRHLSDVQMRKITRTLGVGEVFPGIA
jgi:hypothetical protein